ncbi:unnamed protein product [Arabidopsis arenosa]|uniref:PGG domain-containing protein n=1 Tax=Arabidopsis arenosa TaxID=38785 RepID=A0A8S1ZVM6_ARAAE|nr:unnamed protein product [Arabidopsis arenosa]
MVIKIPCTFIKLMPLISLILYSLIIATVNTHSVLAEEVTKEDPEFYILDETPTIHSNLTISSKTRLLVSHYKKIRKGMRCHVAGYNICNGVKADKGTNSDNGVAEASAPMLALTPSIVVKIGQDSLKPARCSSLLQLAYPYRFNFTAKNSLEKAEIERRRKGKQVVVADDGERTDTGIEVVNGREIGETSNAAAIRGRTGEQIIDIASLTGQNREDQQMQTDAVYKEALLSARNIVALVVIFLATVGCKTGLNPPGGLNNDGKAVLGKEIAFFIFMLAVYTMVPVCIITLGLLCGVTPRSQKVQRNTLKICHTFMWVGLIAFAVAFVSGSWLIVPSDIWWLKLIGALATLAGMIVIISFIWSKKARKQLRRFSFCELDGSSDDDEPATPMVTTKKDK